MASESSPLLERTILQLVQTYKDYAPKCVSRSRGPPTREALLTLQKQNFPAIFTDAFSHWHAPSRWNSQYFREKMEQDRVTVAMTPNGLADSIIDEQFVQPFECQMTMSEMLDWLTSPEPPVRYLQLQNGSLNLEFQKLSADVDAQGLVWANCVFGEEVLTNIWIGNHLSTTSLHHDPYENIYCQIKGSKIFTLYPPSNYHFLNEKSYPSARYRRSSDKTDPMALEVYKDSDSSSIPWLSPPDKLPPQATQFTITLNPGECLYLPALWFHKVQQIDDSEGLCVAVNYWYDLDYSSDLWIQWKFMRKISMIAQGRLKECDKELIEEEDM